MSNASPHITIIGAGITGAAAAYRLSQLGVAADVYEADPNVGGRMARAQVGGSGPAGQGAAGAEVV